MQVTYFWGGDRSSEAGHNDCTVQHGNSGKAGGKLLVLRRLPGVLYSFYFA
jgi:hypothetical protein